MLIKSLMVAGASVLTLQLSSGAVLAQTETNNQSTQKTMEQRIADRKTALKTKLDAALQARLKGKCKASQKLVTAAKTKSDKAIENRQKAYEAVQTRLDALVAALEKANIDTATIADLQTQVDTAIEKLKTDVTAYNQTLTDLAGMNCETDPTGFKATLETARTQRKQVAKDAADLRTLKGKIVNELAKIKGLNASIKNSNETGGGNQ